MLFGIKCIVIAAEFFDINILWIDAEALQHIFCTVMEDKLCFMAAQVSIFVLRFLVAHMIDMVGFVLLCILQNLS